MLTLQIDIGGAISKLELVGNMKWQDPIKKGMEGVKTFVENDVFNSQGGAIQDSWQPLRANTVKDRIRKGFGVSPILQRTGQMRRGFEIREGQNFVELFNTTDYFKYHQSTAPRRRLPRRAMLKATQQVRNIIIREFLKYTNDYIRRNKLA